MVCENDLVAIFHSIHRVMKAEKVLKEACANVLLIPVPRQLSADCGLALRFSPAERERIEAILGESGLLPEELYRRGAQDFERVL